MQFATKFFLIMIAILVILFAMINAGDNNDSDDSNNKM